MSTAICEVCVPFVWDMQSRFSMKRGYAVQVAVADARQTVGRRLAAGFAVKTLSSIMRELRHEWVDVIKVSSSLELASAVL